MAKGNRPASRDGGAWIGLKFLRHADALGLVTFTGHTLAVELLVRRPDDPNPPKLPSGQEVVVGRLALAPPMAAELYNRLVVAVMEQKGMITQQESEPIGKKD